MREAAEEKNARLQEIEFRLGVLPDDILSGQRLPTSATYSHVKNSLVQRCAVSPYCNTAFTDAPCTKKFFTQLYLQGGNDD